MAHSPPPSIDEAHECPEDLSDVVAICVFMIVMLLLMIFVLVVARINAERREQERRQAAARISPMYNDVQSRELKQLRIQVDASLSKAKAVERKYKKLSSAVQAYLAVRAQRACLASTGRHICLHCA